MSLLVLDTSVAEKRVLPEPDSTKALALQDDVRNNVHEIIAPDVFAEEIAHVLTKAERRKIIPVGDAITHVFDILQNGPTLKSFLPLLARAIEISSQTRVGVTDCLFVALAEQEGCDFVTADQRLVASLGQQFPVVALASL